jgi:predicted HAD superfamily phosphohydrolase
LYFGATTRDFEQEALKSRRTPGSQEHITYLKSQNSLLVAVTTAWEQPHRKMVLEHAGFDHLAATDFPIDQIRESLHASGAWSKEIAMTGRWLDRVFALIEKEEAADGEGAKAAATKELKGTIVDFYRNGVGITWDILGHTVSFQLTHLGNIIAGLHVVGDREKAAVVRRLSTQNLLRPGAAGVIFWGDGVNDTIALGDKKGADWRVAFDGAAAAKAANIGVISDDIGRTGIALTQAIQRHPHRRPSDELVQIVVREAQEEIGRDAIIHLAGPTTSEDLLDQHDDMKSQIRGKNGAAIDLRRAKAISARH